MADVLPTTLNELKEKHLYYAAMAMKLNEKIRQRKAELKAQGIAQSQDLELAGLKAKSGRVNANITILKAQIAKLQPSQQPVKQPAKPERPARTLAMWSGCSRYELKVINLLMADVGHVRYKEILKLARHEEPKYDAETRYEHHESMERMMRGNYNKYAGDEI